MDGSLPSSRTSIVGDAADVHRCDRPAGRPGPRRPPRPRLLGRRRPVGRGRPDLPRLAARRRSSTRARRAPTRSRVPRYVIDAIRGPDPRLPEHQRDGPDRPVPRRAPRPALRRSGAAAASRGEPGPHRRLQGPLSRDARRARTALAGLDRALEAGRATDLPVMVHIGGTTVRHRGGPRPAAAGRHRHPRVHRLAPGASSTDAGRVVAAAREARARGVLFDVGHGAGSFTLAGRRGRARRRLPARHDQLRPPPLQRRRARSTTWPRRSRSSSFWACPSTRSSRWPRRRPRRPSAARRDLGDARGRRRGGRHGPAPRGRPLRR